jgi:hypothetical protein
MPNQPTDAVISVHQFAVQYLRGSLAPDRAIRFALKRIADERGEPIERYLVDRPIRPGDPASGPDHTMEPWLTRAGRDELFAHWWRDDKQPGRDAPSLPPRSLRSRQPDER